MIRLSLPAFDPTQPLSFHLETRCLQYATTIHAAFWVDGFVGWVDVPLVGSSPADPAVTPPDGTWRYPMDGDVPVPERIGLTGSEGWFTLKMILPGRVFVTDLVVSYAPISGTVGRQDAYFS